MADKGVVIYYRAGVEDFDYDTGFVKATDYEALRKRCEAVESLATKYPDDGNGDDDAYNAGWNACLEAIAAAQEPSHG